MQEVALNLKEKLFLIYKEQVALRDEFKMDTEGFANRPIVLENNTDDMERVYSTGRPESRFQTTRQRLRHFPSQCNFLDRNL